MRRLLHGVVGTFVQLVGVCEAFFPVRGVFDSVTVKDLRLDESPLGFSVSLALDNDVSGII